MCIGLSEIVGVNIGVRWDTSVSPIFFVFDFLLCHILCDCFGFCVSLILVLDSRIPHHFFFDFAGILAGHNSLGIEMEVAWANPGAFTVHNYACYEDGSNCVSTRHFDDPSKDISKIESRLNAD